MSTRKGLEKPSKQIEISKRSAAGTARTTAGRSRVFQDKSKYNRKQEKIMDTEETQYEARKTEILKELPEEFRRPLADFCYREWHGSGYSDVLIYLEELVYLLKEPIFQNTMNNYNDGYTDGRNANCLGGVEPY